MQLIFFIYKIETKKIAARTISLFIMLVMSVTLYAQSVQDEPPKLLVGIKIDGLKVDKLREWEKSFGVGGFRKLMEEALYFENMQHNIVSAGTTSDIATIMTGTYPFYHGISGDFYFDTKEKKERSVLYDKNEVGIGTSNKFSAHNLLVSNITDELRLKNTLSSVHAIALDAENAIMLGGHMATSVSWIDNIANRWVTSGYYTQGLSRWADQMNVSGDFKKIKNKNTLVNELALTTLNRERLGTANKQTDALLLQFSIEEQLKSGNSNTELNSYILIDNLLQQLFYAINSKIRDSNVLYFIMGSSDAAHTPDLLGRNLIPAGYFNADRALALLNTYLIALYGQENWVLGYYGKNIFLNKAKLNEKQINIAEVEAEVASFMSEFEGILAAYPASEVIHFSGNKNDIRTKIKNSHHKRSSGDVVLSIMPGWLEVDNKARLIDNNNSPQVRLPLFFMGQSITPGINSAVYETIDIAPTLATMLNTALPNATIGKRIDLQ